MKVYLEKWQVRNLRDYFGENDKTQTEHWAFKVFDDALKNKQCIIDDVVGQSEQCTHENEVQRQGDGFVYTVCGDCGEDLD